MDSHRDGQPVLWHKEEVAVQLVLVETEACMSRNFVMLLRGWLPSDHGMNYGAVPGGGITIALAGLQYSPAAVNATPARAPLLFSIMECALWGVRPLQLASSPSALHTATILFVRSLTEDLLHLLYASAFTKGAPLNVSACIIL